MVYNQESTIVIPVFQKNSQEQRRVKNKGREVQGNVPQWCAAALSYQSWQSWTSLTSSSRDMTTDTLKRPQWEDLHHGSWWTTHAELSSSESIFIHTSQVLGMKDGCTAEHTGLTDKLGFSVQIPPELYQLWLSSQLPALFSRNRPRRAFPTWTITSGCCPLGGTDKIKAN